MVSPLSRWAFSATCRLLRLGGHEDKDSQLLLRYILHPVFNPGSRQHALPRTNVPCILPDPEHPPALHDHIKLVGGVMFVGFLGLPGFETVEITEKPFGFTKGILDHSFGRKRGGFFQIKYIHDYTFNFIFWV